MNRFGSALRQNPALAKLVEHGLSNQSDAVLRAPEALGVEFRVLTDDETIGDDDPGVDHRFSQAGAPAALRLGQLDRLVDGRIGARAHAGEQQRP